MAFSKFIPTTVLEPTFIKLAKNEEGKWVRSGLMFTLDSLKISNFTEDGPEKTARGGLNNKIIAKYGKTARLEVEDAIGRSDVLQHLMAAKIIKSSGASIVDGVTHTSIAKLEKGSEQIIIGFETEITGLEKSANGESGWTAVAGGSYTKKDGDSVIVLGTAVVENTEYYRVSYKKYSSYDIQITDLFPGRYAIEGKTFFLQGGEKKWVNFFVNMFVPDGLLSLTMEAEGDFGVFEIGGELIPNCQGELYIISESNYVPVCP